MTVVKLKIGGMHCSSCPIMIEGTIEDNVPGIQSVRANYVKQECEVDFDEAQTDMGTIIKTIESIGYSVDSAD